MVSHSFHIHLEAKYTLACHGVKFSSGKKFWVPMNFLFWELERRVDILVALACKLKEGWFGPLTRLILCEWVNKQAEFTISVDASKRFNILLWDRMHFDERENIQEVRAGQIVVVSGIDRNLGDTITDGSVRCIITGVIFKEGGYQGVYFGQDAAIKFKRYEQSNEALRDEFSNMKQVRHKNIVCFIGVCAKFPHLCMVTEYSLKEACIIACPKALMSWSCHHY